MVVTDFSSLTADQLADHVHEAMFYDARGKSLHLAELVRRASERDAAVQRAEEANEVARRHGIRYQDAEAEVVRLRESFDVDLADAYRRGYQDGQTAQ